MNTMIKRSFAGVLAVGATALASLPASAMPVAQHHGASALLQLSSWGDRVRGRTSSSTPGLFEYGYGYNGGYAGRYRNGYDQVPYGYNQGAPAGYSNGYGYGEY